MKCPLPSSPYRSAFLRTLAGILVISLGAACAGDRVGPSEAGVPTGPTAPAPADTTATAPIDSTVPPDSTTVPPTDTTTSGTLVPTVDVSTQPGIVFGSFNMPKEALSSVLNGTLPGGMLSPSNIMALLADARAKGARYIIKMCNGRDTFVKNADGTFSFTKWKALVDRYRSFPLTPYLNDGTILGHYMIDEPSVASRWGGKIIPQATIEAMAKYSKQIWPGMTTFVRVVPSWLAQAPITYTYLDAAWAQYASRFGDPTAWVSAEKAVAQRKGLGLVVGMNIINGGNGSSGIPGTSSRYSSMSASELTRNGTALLNQSYACGFMMWMYYAGYYGRSDIRAAMAALSAKAKAHTKTSCRQ